MCKKIWKFEYQRWVPKIAEEGETILTNAWFDSLSPAN
jgi:hypothetical protein